MGVIRPQKLLLISFFVWLFFYLQVPVTYIYNGTAFFPILTLILFITSFLLGIFSKKRRTIKPHVEISNQKTRQLTFVFFCIGLLGVLLKIYIGTFKSGIYSSGDIFEQRLENMGKELTGGAIGAIASILYPFGFIALLILLYNYKAFKKRYMLFIFLVGIYPFVETYFMGGRTVIVLLGTTMIFVIYASYIKNTNFKTTVFKLFKIKLLSIPKFIFKKRILLPLIVCLILFVSYSIQVLDQRLTRFNYGDRVLNIWEQNDYQWVKFSDDFKASFYSSSTDEKSRMLGIFSLKHYFVHGMFEYVRLVNDLDKCTGYYFGQYEFNVFFKFFRILGIPLKSFSELNNVVKRQAVYQTFWGPFYIDFGFFGVIFAFFWGRFVKRVFVNASRGSTPYLIMYAYLCTIILASFFINFLLGSSSYFLFAFFISIMAFKLWPNDLKIKVNV